MGACPSNIQEHFLLVKVPIPIVVPIPAWIRIWAIPIPTLLMAILNPDPDPLKRGIITSLILTVTLLASLAHALIQ